jgi:multimeric flavodoxin WrbA
VKIGIVIHSKTGHTAGVGQRILAELVQNGDPAEYLELSAKNDAEMKVELIELESVPSLESYDVVILGAPVRAFSLSPVMKSYLKQVNAGQGQTALCFVTHQFPLPWMGGNQAIRQFKAACAAKGLKVIGTKVVDWSNKNRETTIDHLIDSFTKAVQGLR